jgi:hypothetical protein
MTESPTFAERLKYGVAAICVILESDEILHPLLAAHSATTWMDNWRKNRAMDFHAILFGL